MKTGDFAVRSLALSVYLPTFLFAVGQGAAIPVLPLLALDLSESVPLAGAIVAVRSLGSLIFDIPAGMLVSRIGERQAMLVGTSLLSLVAVGAGLRPSVVIFGLLVFLMGGAWSIWALARLVYATDMTPKEHRGKVMSIIGGSTRLGSFLGPLLGGLAVALFGLPAAFFVQAGFALVAAATLFLVTVPVPVGETGVSSTLSRRFGSWRAPFTPTAAS